MIEIEDNMGHSPTTEYLETGHTCPRCHGTTICTIEDGSCFNQGLCSGCNYQKIVDEIDYDPDVATIHCVVCDKTSQGYREWEEFMLPPSSKMSIGDWINRSDIFKVCFSCASDTSVDELQQIMERGNTTKWFVL